MDFMKNNNNALGNKSHPVYLFIRGPFSPVDFFLQLQGMQAYLDVALDTYVYTYLSWLHPLPALYCAINKYLGALISPSLLLSSIAKKEEKLFLAARERKCQSE